LIDRSIIIYFLSFCVFGLKRDHRLAIDLGVGRVFRFIVVGHLLVVFSNNFFFLVDYNCFLLVLALNLNFLFIMALMELL
jgi:hypothetical protein